MSAVLIRGGTVVGTAFPAAGVPGNSGGVFRRCTRHMGGFGASALARTKAHVAFGVCGNAGSGVLSRRCLGGHQPGNARRLDRLDCESATGADRFNRPMVVG